MTDPHLLAPVSNGNPREQALIRQWWNEEANRLGELVWEYCVDGYYMDAVLFTESKSAGIEHPGLRARQKFPIDGKKVVLCEAKVRLTPELVGQALVYSELMKRAGAKIESTLIFCEEAGSTIRSVAEGFGLRVVLGPTRSRVKRTPVQQP